MIEEQGPAPVAAIDVGTNSIHLLVARPLGGSGFETVAREKEMVRLGSGPGDMKMLETDAIDRAVAALDRFRKIADGSGATVRAVATSAVREAENKDEFLRRAWREAGVRVEVIAGTEEARLIHLGILQAVPVFDKRLLLIDIGGGSTEFLVGRQGRSLEARSLKLGAIRLSDRFFRREPNDSGQVKACRVFIRSYLSPVVHDLGKHGFEVAVGSSGTIGSVADMALAQRDPRASVGARPMNPTIGRDEVDAVVDALTAAKTAKARSRIAGLAAERSDIILAGAVLLQVVMAEFDIKEIVVSDYALREGLLLDTWHRHHAAALHHLDDIRYQSVLQVDALVPEERVHNEQARRLAVELFDGTAPVHEFGRDERELLEAAALLANVGLVISHSRHHLHSYYVIRNAERLAGFNEREVEIIAQVARYHRKSAPKPKHAEFSALATEDQHLVRVLAGLLRVASALDRSYSAVVRNVRCGISDDGVVVHADVTGDAQLEEYTAGQRRDLLESALGRPITFRLHPHP